jgi:hypothetical protein
VFLVVVAMVLPHGLFSPNDTISAFDYPPFLCSSETLLYQKNTQTHETEDEQNGSTNKSIDDLVIKNQNRYNNAEGETTAQNRRRMRQSAVRQQRLQRFLMFIAPISFRILEAPTFLFFGTWKNASHRSEFVAEISFIQC